MITFNVVSDLLFQFQVAEPFHRDEADTRPIRRVAITSGVGRRWLIAGMNFDDSYVPALNSNHPCFGWNESSISESVGSCAFLEERD